jgi:predicted transcriptional regulator
LWEKTKRYAGITKSHFFDYFSNKEIGFAIRIKSVKKYRKELNLKEKYNIVPPQSFIYLDPVSINR